ncbi:hypothetical protein [Devosia ginsengisoli]|nr:hypothetical protein [Devosia ginsengisoli]MCR6672219.1 hypothetical protein [Devosia ginsengisoli]
MTRKLDPVASRQATKEAMVIAGQRAWRTTVVGLSLAALIVVITILS